VLPESSRPKSSQPPRWAFALVGWAAFLFLLHVYAGVWTPQYGITKFLRAGTEFNTRGTAVYRATPKYMDPYPAHRWGFDGQLYAQMALDPLLRDPQLHHALDDPPYRGQRILVSWLAWLVGLGRPFWVLNAYAGMNLLFWIAFAWLGARLFRPHGWTGLAGYAAVLLTCGIIESMQASLTDFPSFVLVLGAIVAGGTGGAALLAAAGLARTPALLGFVGLAEFPPPWGEALKKNLVRGLVATLPVALWVAYVLWRFRGREVSVAGGNIALPFQGMMEKLGEFSVVAGSGSIRWHRWWYELYKSYDLHAVLTMISVVTQGVFLALHRDWKNPLWRWGAVIAVYFSCISYLSWESHFTITRHALPLTFVFNLLLAARAPRGWAIWFLLGNCFVPFGIRFFDRMTEYHAPPAPAEYQVAAGASPALAHAVQLQFGAGWWPQQWDDDTTWRWAAAPQTTLTLHNAALRPVRVELAFLTRTRDARTLTVRLGDRTLLTQPLPRRSEVLVVPAFELPPGDTTLALETDGGLSDSEDGTEEKVTFRVESPRLRIITN
jgi:hypothetical protein